MHMSVETSDLLEQEVQVVVSLILSVLATELRAPARAVRVLNHQTISPAPTSSS